MENLSKREIATKLKWGKKRVSVLIQSSSQSMIYKDDTLPVLLRQLEQQGKKKKRLSRPLWGSMRGLRLPVFYLASQSQREISKVLGRSSSSFFSFPSAVDMGPMKPHTMEWLAFFHSGFSLWASVLPVLRYVRCELKSQTQRILKSAGEFLTMLGKGCKTKFSNLQNFIGRHLKPHSPWSSDTHAFPTLDFIHSQ